MEKCVLLLENHSKAKSVTVSRFARLQFLKEEKRGRVKSSDRKFQLPKGIFVQQPILFFFPPNPLDSPVALWLHAA